MIVKNEEKVITRLLESVITVIDTFCICDTGCTDNTINIMRDFFNKHNIKGKFVFEEFKDFGHNRTFALKQCLSMDADYILLLDADMVLSIDASYSVKDLKRQIKNYDAIYIFQGSDKFFYKNVRLVKNTNIFSYWGVTHEYVKIDTSNPRYGTINKNEIFINDIGDGGAKSDKFLRDIRLLSKGLEEDPDNDRYNFYIANSYKDLGQFDNAIKHYLHRIKVGGWFEEIWYSYYNIGHCYKFKGDMVNAIHYWMEAYQFYPKRLENLYEIIGYYRNNGKNNLAYAFFMIADNQRKLYLNQNVDYLFLEKDVYEYKLDYELSIIGYYCNEHNFDLAKYCMRVISNPIPEEYIIRNVFSNYKFYTPKLVDFSIQSDYLKKLDSLSKTALIKNDDFVSSSPSLVFHDGELFINVRFVNYSIDDNGNYVQKEKIETRNVLYTFNTNNQMWIQTDSLLLNHNTDLDNLYVGLEDLRLFSYNDKLLYIANRGLSYHNICIETGTIDTNTGVLFDSGMLKKENQGQIEKNWLLFNDEKNNKLKCVYNWYPLIIGDIWYPLTIGEEDIISTFEFTQTHSIPTPNFFRFVRGSTNGVNIGDEIWFICHVVSYEDRRFYYHIFVVLDKDTLNLKRYSKLFTFCKEKVEYTLGFVFMKDEFIIGYSTLDKTTNFIQISKESIENLFI